MHLAKDALDVGLYTNQVEAMRSFYERAVGLPYEELLKAGGGVHQHRLGLRGAVLKLNASRDQLAEAPSGFRRLLVAADVDEPTQLHDPDGLPVTLVPRGHSGIETAGVEWAATDPQRLRRLLDEGFDAIPAADGALRIGRTLVLVTGGGTATGPLRARGFRYLTVQVHDVRAEHQRLCELGWREATAPRRLGDVAVISFVRDPDGNFVEVSQRASLTGALPDG